MFLLSFFPSFFFFSPCNLRGRWRELNENRSQIGSNVIWKRMSEIWDTPSPINRGPKNHLFGRPRNLTAILTAYIFGMKHDIDKRSSALTTTRGLLHRPKMSWILVYKRLQTRPPFYPPFVNSTFCFIARQASQTEISKRNSTKLCQVMDSKSLQQTAVQKSEPSLSQKLGAKNFCICSVFRRLQDLMANIFLQLLPYFIYFLLLLNKRTKGHLYCR